MAMNRIEYRTITAEELVKTWRESHENDDFSAIETTEYSTLCRLIGHPLRPIDSFDYISEVIEVAKECGLKFCYQCNVFVEEPYYNETRQMCIQCQVDN